MIYVTIMAIKINIDLDYTFYNFLFLTGRNSGFNKYNASEGSVKSFSAANG